LKKASIFAIRSYRLNDGKLKSHHILKSNPLVEILTTEIRKEGALPFSRFMELALYCPDYGFYEKEKDTLGRRGDFYTSVSVGPLFGQMLAFQFVEWVTELPIADRRLRIVEAGAHDGKLAADILDWLRQQRTNIYDGLEYCIVEPSERRRQWQGETLIEFRNKIRWLASISDLENQRSAIASRQFAIIFSNELLDAFPVHRLGWDAKNKTWFVWGVALEGGRFVWARMPRMEIVNAKVQMPDMPDDLLEVLPDGFTTEICPAVVNWWRAAADALRCGKLLTFDYGLTAEEFFKPERSHGTLRAYHRHYVGDDLLANVGEQDITAHVNFSSIQAAGEAAGLKTETFVTQSKFLTEIAEKIWKAQTEFGEWTPAQTRQFQTLTHPEHLGRPFRVLVQSRLE
jgi:SAM-dependent MidA family methyltransferase